MGLSSLDQAHIELGAGYALTCLFLLLTFILNTIRIYRAFFQKQPVSAYSTSSNTLIGQNVWSKPWARPVPPLRGYFPQKSKVLV